MESRFTYDRLKTLTDSDLLAVLRGAEDVLEEFTEKGLPTDPRLPVDIEALKIELALRTA